MNSKQALYNEIERHILQDEKPSQFLDAIRSSPAMKEHPFHFLSRLEQVEQSPVHHPEGNVWIHTMMVLDSAAQRKSRSTNQRVFMWAALLHDIGKAVTTEVRKGRITAYDHDKAGEELAIEFLKEFEQDKQFISEVSALVRWHMQLLFVVRSLPFAEIKKMKQQVSIHEVALLALCDRLGRTNADIKKEEENIRNFIEKCESV